MKILNQLIQLLKKPFPQEESRSGSLKTITSISVFVVLFLYIFKPFDINRMESDKFWICLGFGSMTFLASIIYEYGIVPLIGIKRKPENFTFGRWIIYMMGLILCISLANFLFVRYVFFGYVLWEFFPHMLRSTIAIGIFPIVILGGLALKQQEKKYQNISEEINQKPVQHTENATSNNLSVFNIPVHQIKYVEALQNYAKIGYIHANGQLVEQTERVTLKRILEDAEGSSIVKCHRSFLVNREAIISTDGNAQGLLLNLSNCDKIIPVSRSFVAVFRDS